MTAGDPLGVRYVRQVSLPPGTRVVVRYRLADGANDVLGVLEVDDGTSVRVRRHDGRLVEVADADVLALKAVPPPPERRAGRTR